MVNEHMQSNARIDHRSLTFRWMLKAAVDDGPEQLWLQQKVPEA